MCYDEITTDKIIAELISVFNNFDDDYFDADYCEYVYTSPDITDNDINVTRMP